MCEYYIIMYVYSFYTLLIQTNISLYKLWLIFLNQIYFSWYFFILMFYITYISSAQTKALVFCFVIYKNYFYTSQNLVLLKYIFLFKYSFSFVLDLVIGWVIIHPFLFYLSIFILFGFYFQFCFKHFFNFFNYFILFYIIVISFILGGFWGWLNFSWGYLWVYDSIEFLLLYFIILLQTQFHHKPYKNYFYINYLFLIYLVVYYWLIRYNFIITRHAAFKVITVLILKNYFYIYILNPFFIFITLFIKSLQFSLLAINVLIYYMGYYTCWYIIIIDFLFDSIILWYFHFFLLYICIYFFLHISNYFISIYFKVKYNFYASSILQHATLLTNNYLKKIVFKKTLFLQKKFQFNIFFFYSFTLNQFFSYLELLLQYFLDYYFYIIFIIFLFLIKLWLLWII